MEFKFSVNEIFRHPIVKIGSNMVPPGFTGDRRAFWDILGKVSEIINAIGESSAAAQGLTKPITTADRLRNSEHVLYLLIDQNAGNGRGAVTGMLKTGKKGLYVFDRNGQHYQVSPPCVLDFYIHESRQRTGLGKRLFEHMLQEEKIEPVKMAIDRPSDKFLGFLNKHYSLNNPVKQMNNYVVFDGFFPSTPEKNSAVEVQNHSGGTPGKKQSANGLQTTSFTSPMGRYGAPRPPCSMGQIIHNQTSTIPNNTEPTGTGGVRSVPDVNYQGTANERNPNITQSAPDMHYQSYPQQKLDGLDQTPAYQTYNESEKSQYYQQQQNYGNPGIIVPNADESGQMGTNNMYQQDNAQATQQQNITPFQQQQLMQNQYSVPSQNAQIVASIANNNVQNPGLAPQQPEMAHIPNMNHTIQQEGYNAQTNAGTQNVQQYASQGTQNMQQYPTQYQYTTQTMQPILQQPITVGHMQNQVPHAQTLQSTTPNEPFAPNATLVTPASAPQMSYVPEVVQSSSQYTPEISQYQYNIPVPQQNLQNNPQYTTIPSVQQTLPISYTIQETPPGYTMPTTPYPQHVSTTLVPPYATNIPATQYAPTNIQSSVDNQYNNQVVQNQSTNMMTNQISQPCVVTNQVVEPAVAMTTQVPEATISMTNHVPPTNVIMTNQIQSQPTIPSAHQISSQPSVLVNEIGTIPQHQPQNMPQFTPQHVSQPVMAGSVNAPNLTYSVPNMAQPTVSMTNQVPQTNTILTNRQPTMTSQPNATIQNVSPQYQPQNMAQYSTHQTPSQPALGADIKSSRTNIPYNVTANMPKQSPSEQRRQANETFQYNYNPVMDNAQNMAVHSGMPQTRRSSTRIRNPQFSLVGRTNVPNEPQPVYAQGDTRLTEGDSLLQYGYPSQVPDPDTQVEEEKVNSSPKLERPRSLSIQLSEEQTEDKKNDVESEVLPKETDIEEESIEKLAISENGADIEQTSENIPTPENKTPGKRTPSHLTDQGFFDLKFYHNKLW